MITVTEAIERLSPYNATLGEHNVDITWFSSTSGIINIMMNWKCFIGEMYFSNLDELEQHCIWIEITYPLLDLE